MLLLYALTASLAASPYVTGNGFGFAVVSSSSAVLTRLYAHPYSFQRPDPKDPLGEGIPTPNFIKRLAFEEGQDRHVVSYVQESHVISAKGPDSETFFFMPYGLTRNALVVVREGGPDACLRIDWEHPVRSRMDIRGARALSFEGVEETLLLIPIEGALSGQDESCLKGRAWALVSSEAGFSRWRGGLGPQALVKRELKEAEAWRVKPAVRFSSEAERRLWRQSETILRMGQSRERAGKGLIVACLPEGSWSVAWVRDMAYAAVAFARMGHRKEARMAVEAYFRARPVGRLLRETRGLPYQISAVRYFGDGSEEPFFTMEGATNMEFDNWGLALWALGEYVERTGDKSILRARTYRGTLYESARDYVLKPLLGNLDKHGDGLIVAEDTSIWEERQVDKKHFAFSTAAAIRGLRSFDALTDAKTRRRIREVLPLLEKGFHQAYASTGRLRGTFEESFRNDVDGAVLTAINWGIETDPAIVRRTVDSMGALKVASGGYRRVRDEKRTPEQYEYWYEKQEFLFIDLSLAEALLRLGEREKARSLLSTIVEKSDRDHGFIPEMYVSQDCKLFSGALGDPTGAIPMVGYGAGAYILHLLEREALLPDPVEARVEDLLSRMSPEEKFGQLQQLDGNPDGTAKPEHFILAKEGHLGSVLSVRGAANVNALQRAAVEGSRLKIPILFGHDVIHGYRTVLPVPLGLAATWDPTVVEQAASVAAAEAAAAGLKWTFAPMVDIARDPRWGRIVEGAGEDPFLGSAMAAAQVRGFQGKDPAAPEKVAACAKHWAAYGAAEGGRDYNTTDVPERTLREVYFPPFKAAVDAGVLTFMSAFNDLNGIPATANRWLLRDVLRKEWGFSGFVVSDYNAVLELIAHRYAADGAHAAAAALDAGVDMEMVSWLYSQSATTLPMDRVDEAVRRILRVKFQLGLFERPYVDETREAAVLLSPAHKDFARRAAERSFVLLKNERGVLPLSKGIRTLAVIGPLADDASAPLGPWSDDGRQQDVITPLAALRAELPSAKVLHASGTADAVAAAKRADAVVLVLGEGPRMSGEAASRASLGLPGRQAELADAVLSVGRPTVVVLMNGRPLVLGDLAEKAPAILETWFAGIQAGPAIADTLFGDSNPGGKLPVTFPRSVGQVPIYYSHKATGRPPLDDNKYRSRYLDEAVTPLYPFGYGLSYTTFQLEDLRVSPGRASVRVRNTGPRAGDETVQAYIQAPAAGVTRPVRELKGFARVTLAPGESRDVDIALGGLGSYDAEMDFKTAPGTYLVFVGTDSTGGMEGSFEVPR